MVALLVALAFALFAWYALQHGLAMYVIGAAVVSPFLMPLIRSPIALAALVIASQAWGRYNIGPFLTPFKITGVLLAISLLGRIVQRRRILPVPGAFMAAMLVLCAIVLASEVMAPFGASMYTLYELMGTIGMFLMLSQMPMDDRAIRVIGLGQTAAIVLVALVVFNEVGWSRLGTGIVRARGPMAQPNLLAEECARALPFAIAILIDRDNKVWIRLLGMVGILAAAYGQFAAASRGGSVGMLFGLALFAVIAGRTAAARFANVFVLVVLLAAFVAMSPKSYDERVMGTVRAEESAGDITSERMSHWEFSKVMIPQRPFLGWGSTGFSSLHAYRVSGRLTALHSSILSVATNYGIPALTLYVLVVLTSFFVGYRAIRQWSSGRIYGYALLGTAASSVVASISGTSVFRLPIWFPILLLYLIAHARTLQARERAFVESGADEPQIPAALPAPRVGA